jgi:hypothetical protein
MELWAYDVRATDGGMIQHLSPLPHVLVFEVGLPEEAIIGSARAGQPITEHMTQNPAFVAFMHHVIASMRLSRRG